MVSVVVIAIIVIIAAIGTAMIIVSQRKLARVASPVVAPAPGRLPRVRHTAATPPAPFSPAGARRAEPADLPEVVAAPEPVPTMAEPVVAAAEPVVVVASPVAIAAPESPATPHWSEQFDSRFGALDEVARLRLIGDLGVVAQEWCVPLLSRAYDEEARPANRQAALIALAACHHSSAIPTFEHVLETGDSAECAIASDALADLEPPAKTKPYIVIEHR